MKRERRPCRDGELSARDVTRVRVFEEPEVPTGKTHLSSLSQALQENFLHGFLALESVSFPRVPYLPQQNNVHDEHFMMFKMCLKHVSADLRSDQLRYEAEYYSKAERNNKIKVDLQIQSVSSTLKQSWAS